MTRTKIILGLALATSLASFVPAYAAPIAAARAAVTMSASDGSVLRDVVQVNTHPTRRHRHQKSHKAYRH